jgi:hypothetical protein
VAWIPPAYPCTVAEIGLGTFDGGKLMDRISEAFNKHMESGVALSEPAGPAEAAALRFLLCRLSFEMLDMSLTRLEATVALRCIELNAALREDQRFQIKKPPSGRR